MAYTYNPLIKLGLDLTSPGGAAGPGYVGSFADLTALQTAHPTSAAGAFALLQDTNTFYVWDTLTSAWVPSTGAATNREAETDADLTAGQAVYIKNTGHLGLAQANGSPQYKLTGLAAADTLATFSAPFITDGPLELVDWTAATGGATLTIGTTYYLDSTTSGGLTATVPTATGEYVIEIGKAETTTRLNIEIQPSILL